MPSKPYRQNYQLNYFIIICQKKNSPTKLLLLLRTFPSPFNFRDKFIVCWFQDSSLRFLNNAHQGSIQCMISKDLIMYHQRIKIHLSELHVLKKPSDFISIAYIRYSFFRFKDHYNSFVLCRFLLVIPNPKSFSKPKIVSFSTYCFPRKSLSM